MCFRGGCTSPIAGRPRPLLPLFSPAPSPEPINPQLLDEYTRLKERYLRTTNALASAAHDLKTPLSILNGYVEVLQSEKLGGLNPRQREVLRDMRSSGRRLEHFIQDFLTYSVLETGELKLHYEPGDLNTCLAEVCRLWSPRFQDRGIALYFLPHDKLVEFAFDSAKVERVISNLLENASKFTPTGGTVWLHAEPYMWERRSVNKAAVAGERRRRSLSVPNSVKLSVADTGPGIPAEYHIEVFDDFSAFPRPKLKLTAWAWGWPLPGAWSTPWAARSGWKASLVGVVSFPSSFRLNRLQREPQRTK